MLLLNRLRLLTAIEARWLDSMRNVRSSIITRLVTKVSLAIHRPHLNGLLLVEGRGGEEALVTGCWAWLSDVLERVNAGYLIVIRHLVRIFGAEYDLKGTWPVLSHRNSIIEGSILQALVNRLSWAPSLVYAVLLLLLEDHAAVETVVRALHSCLARKVSSAIVIKHMHGLEWLSTLVRRGLLAPLRFRQTRVN